MIDKGLNFKLRDGFSAETSGIQLYNIVDQMLVKIWGHVRRTYSCMVHVCESM